MQLARVLAFAGAIFGGSTACNDHNPTVVFPVDAGEGGKIEAGASPDGGGIIDVSTPVDVGIDRKVDLHQVVDGPAPFDGVGG
jgi:hypothetical protein